MSHPGILCPIEIWKSSVQEPNCIQRLAKREAYFFPAKSSSATLSFCPTLPLLSFSAGPGPVDDPASFVSFASVSAAAFFSLSVSSALMSLVFASCSSSLSPRLKGSWSSASGFGATDVRGCHFLVLFAPGDGWRGGVGLRYSASTSSTGPDCGGLGVGLKRSGFAEGRLERF